MQKEIYDIVSKFLMRTSNKAELEKAISLFEDPYHNLELRPTLYELWNNGETDEIDGPSEGYFSELLNEIHHKINLGEKEKVKSKLKVFIWNTTKVAAILILGLVLGIYIQNMKIPEPVYFTSVAPKGSVSQAILPDGTLIYLNAGSEIKYELKSTKKTREVSLIGEAWFDVKKNPEGPFIVHTPFYDVKVLGTQFNVKTYKEDETVVTTLEKGSIKILPNESFKMKDEIILEPGEQLTYNKTKRQIYTSQVETSQYTSWKSNKLIFLEMSFGDLIKLLERRYGVEIEVTDESLLKGHYTGTIKNESILEIMNIIQHTHPIQYKIDGQKIIISKK